MSGHGLNQFKERHKVNTKPSPKDLQRYFTPHYAAHWRVIGTQLGLSTGALDIVKGDHHHERVPCCNAMLEQWLQMDITASWGKLFTAIESPAVSCSASDKATLLTSKLDQFTISGAETIAVLSKRVRDINIQTRLRVDEEAWPPVQPKTFTPLVLIQHQGDRNLKQSVAMAKFVERGHIDKVVSSMVPRHHPKLDSHEPLQEVLDTSKVTKEIAEILVPLETSNDPQFILIEGAPGIGKSLLLKEIAYCWGIKQVLQKYKLVLLVCLRDPSVQKVSLINHLLQPFCEGDMEATEIASACSKYLLNSSGKDLALLLDGYDEYPETLRKDSLIAYILNRRVLPHCGLIVSSRPHASVSLREQATVKVDVLGFAETERNYYIRESLKGQPQKIDELTQYLQSHSTISSLCFVPFNIVVLVYLYKKGTPLPKNSAELYNHFISLTICRHLVKHGHHLQSNFIQLTNLPEPYNRIIRQLSRFSLEALNKDKLIFTLDEIKAACPDIVTIPGAINGFGLLQAVKHFGIIGTTTTFNFLHFSIQEYLAAHYIANLPGNEELRIIKEKFRSEIHLNVFSIYIALTKGQRSAFKHFLSGGNKEATISDKFLKTQLQCFRLYRCFHEANDVDICNTIQQSVTFSDKEIILCNQTLTTTTVECISVFLASSFHKEWSTINLFQCYIQDHGFHMLYRGLYNCSNITIYQLWLNSNNLTTKSSSLISDLTVMCKVRVLVINGNHTVGENQQLYSMLTDPSNMLEELYMYNTELSSAGAITLFTALKFNDNLKVLNISGNTITDDACDAIITAMERNSCLVTLYMNDNPLTDEAIENIVSSLAVNNALALLEVSECPEATKKRISYLQDDINKKRENRGCQVILTIDYPYNIKNSGSLLNRAVYQLGENRSYRNL